MLNSLLRYIRKNETLLAYMLLYPYILLCIVFLIFPSINLLNLSLREMTRDFQLSDYVGLQNYLMLLAPPYLPIILRTLWYASLTSILCLLIGFPTAYYLSMRVDRGKRFLLLLLFLPFWIGFMIRTYSLNLLLRSDSPFNVFFQIAGFSVKSLGLLGAPFAVILGLTLNLLPIMTLILYYSLENFDRTLIEAAEDLGAKPVTIFFTILLPQCSPGIIVAILIIFTAAAGDFIAPEFLGSGDTVMIANLLESLFSRVPNPPLASSIALIFITVIIAVSFLWYFLYGRKKE